MHPSLLLFLILFLIHPHTHTRLHTHALRTTGRNQLAHTAGTMSAPLTVFLTTYNTGLQGSKAQEQDLYSWLIPILQTQAREQGAAEPDIYAIAVQELLPLHLACECWL